jgi:predicted DNA-binding helix-hairpin-helix protein
MTASLEALLRVPGVGVVTARRIVKERGASIIRNLADLQRMGVQTTRAAGFLSLRGRVFQTSRWTEQLGFWQPGDEVGAYHPIYDVSPGTFR